MDPTENKSTENQLPLEGQTQPPAGDQAQPSSPAAEKPAAEKPAAEKPAAEKPAAEKPAAEKPAAKKPAAEKPAKPAAKKSGKPPRPRRGPPPEGVEEARIDMILTTSKLSGEGGRLRRGIAVSVPERRAGQMLDSGKVRKATKAEIETAVRRFGPVVRIR